jgi:signal transduction histidine kinase/CheY-like chemotaxis protein
MTTILLIAFVILLTLTGGLLVALYRSRKTVRSLALKLEQANERQREDQRELRRRSALDSLKDEFVSTVSHELRTPLTSIRGALGLLNSGVLGAVDKKSANLLRIALTNTDRLIRLINDILDLERMDSGRSVLQTRRCSLSELIHQAVDTMTAMADTAEVKLSTQSASQARMPSVYFDGDPDRILQVITNLLSNAIKFSPPLSTVTIEVETPPDALIFRVADQGRGIPEEQLETIFERFQQVEHADAKERGGTGLGLAICRSIVQQHGGTIWAMRNPLRGASVCVRLPRLQRTYDSADQGQKPLPASENILLLCDVDSPLRSVTAGQLRGRGHTVLEAGTTSEAILLAAQAVDAPVQAILLDLHLFDSKGWGVLKVLTKDPATAHIPVVILSVQTPTGTESVYEEDPGTIAVPDGRLFEELGLALRSSRGEGYVLLVEDDPSLASAVLAGFERTDVHLEHAPTLQRAIVLCGERRPDLMILDLTLPDGNGFSLVEWLRGQPGLRSLPLIVYSGREVSEEERERLRLGPTHFLTKARVHAHDVEELVLTMVHRGRMRLPDDSGSKQFRAS